ncbi:MAG: hypothetical protein WBY47_06215 [Desulfobacterales bacterium]|jgi:hypothetical protein
MLIYDDIYAWSGWGGKLKLGSGKCRLRIYDLKKGNKKGLMYLRPIIVVVSDVKDSKISIRSCSSHIATLVTKAFNIDPLRMLWVEYYPEHKYGAGDTHSIPEKLDAVEFSWYEDKAIQPRWRSLMPPLLDEIKKLIRE